MSALWCLLAFVCMSLARVANANTVTGLSAVPQTLVTAATPTSITFKFTPTKANYGSTKTITFVVAVAKIWNADSTSATTCTVAQTGSIPVVSGSQTSNTSGSANTMAITMSIGYVHPTNEVTVVCTGGMAALPAVGSNNPTVKVKTFTDDTFTSTVTLTVAAKKPTGLTAVPSTVTTLLTPTIVTFKFTPTQTNNGGTNKIIFTVATKKIWNADSNSATTCVVTQTTSSPVVGTNGSVTSGTSSTANVLTITMSTGYIHATNEVTVVCTGGMAALPAVGSNPTVQVESTTDTTKSAAATITVEASKVGSVVGFC